jgi:IMP dehydrogenase
MAQYINDVSRTFAEYILIPDLTTKECIPSNVSLKSPVVKFKKGEKSAIQLNIPVVSAIMQAVSDHNLAIALARNGGLSFIFGSQPIESQVEMVRRVKKYKSGFVVSDSNLTPEHTLEDVIRIKEQTGHSTIGITENGTSNGKLFGLITSRDYRVGRDNQDKKVSEFMTPFNKLITGNLGISLSEANDIIWDHKLNCLPIIDCDHNLQYFVFRKDYDAHKQHPEELLDSNKKLMVGAGINTKDYTERVPKLVEAGADILCIDSSDGFSEWQEDTIRFVR